MESSGTAKGLNCHGECIILQYLGKYVSHYRAHRERSPVITTRKSTFPSLSSGYISICETHRLTCHLAPGLIARVVASRRVSFTK